jgi:putative intracellular protease/amidase
MASGPAPAVAQTVAEPLSPPITGTASRPFTLRTPKAGRTRPLVVVVAANGGAETTDYIVPYGVLKDSGVAEVRSLSTEEGPVQLVRALRIEADQTLAEFDADEPTGADIVIVPALAKPNDPVLIAWLRDQAARGAVIVSVCEGARVLAHARLLGGRRATTHWSALEDLERKYPDTFWVRDLRYVQDGPIISTTGVTASIPMSLALVESIGGPEAARATAARLGVSDWSPVHQTSDYHLSNTDILRAVGSILAFWTHETLELPISDGVDEVTVALRSDVWSRSYRARVVTTANDTTPVISAHGLRILPDDTHQRGRFVIPPDQGRAADQLDRSIEALGERYGAAARRFAVTGMEYVAPGVQP